MTTISVETVWKRLEGHRVLLVGGAGFIGHHLALGLRADGVEVMCVDNLMVNSLIDNAYSSDLDPVRRVLYSGFLDDRFALMREAGVELRNADARITVDLAQAFEDFRPTKVVHLSAIASAVASRKNLGLTFDLQLVTLRNVLELCRRHHQEVEQVLLMSSSTVYGDFKTKTVDEGVHPQPRGIYANTKYIAEQLLRTYRDQYEIGVTVVRPSALYGERCISRRVSQVFIENALCGKNLLLEGGGDGRLDFTYIADLTDGLIRALAMHESRPRSHSNTFNLTFGRSRTIAELAAIVQKVVPNVVLEERPRAEEKPIRGTLSTERATAVLGFEPRWPLEEGYLRYCEWYAERWENASKRVG